MKEKDIYAAWAGGKKGSETINRFVNDLKGHINENVLFFYCYLKKIIMKILLIILKNYIILKVKY